MAIWSHVLFCQVSCENMGMMPKQTRDLALSKACLGILGNKRRRHSNRVCCDFTHIYNTYILKKNCKRKKNIISYRGAWFNASKAPQCQEVHFHYM